MAITADDHKRIPHTPKRAAKIFPPLVDGTKSPYPMVLRQRHEKYRASRIDQEGSLKTPL
jgi:hypothetical protein